MHRTLVALAATAVCLIAAPAAFAWSGAQITSISCPEIHALLPVENGNWQVTATDEQGHVLLNVQVAGSRYEQVIGGLYTLDQFTHQVTVTIGNAANINDGKVTLTRQLTNCQAPIGTPGPAGPKGDPGTSYDCAGNAVPTGGAPALCPGTPGTTITIEKSGDPPKQCVSRRQFALTLPKSYRGVKKLRVVVGGRSETMTVRNGKVRITLAGLPRGIYAVAVRKAHHRTVRRLYTVCGAGNVTAFNVRIKGDPKPDSVSRG